MRLGQSVRVWSLGDATETLTCDEVDRVKCGGVILAPPVALEAEHEATGGSLWLAIIVALIVAACAWRKKKTSGAIVAALMLILAGCSSENKALDVDLPKDLMIGDVSKDGKAVEIQVRNNEQRAVSCRIVAATCSCAQWEKKDVEVAPCASGMLQVQLICKGWGTKRVKVYVECSGGGGKEVHIIEINFMCYPSVGDVHIDPVPAAVRVGRAGTEEHAMWIWVADPTRSLPQPDVVLDRADLVARVGLEERQTKEGHRQWPVTLEWNGATKGTRVGNMEVLFGGSGGIRRNFLVIAEVVD